MRTRPLESDYLTDMFNSSIYEAILPAFTATATETSLSYSSFTDATAP
jgi:hypothetical protein